MRSYLFLILVMGASSSLVAYQTNPAPVHVAPYFVAQQTNPAPVHVAPYFLQQPSNLTVTSGSHAEFVSEAGGSTPLEYKWTFIKDGAADKISVGTKATLDLGIVHSSNAGIYYVTASNYDCEKAPCSLTRTQSTQARLTVLPAPQVIHYTPPGDKILSEPAFQINAWTDSGLSITYTDLSPSGTIVLTPEGLVTLLQAGQASVKLEQSGSPDYAPAPPVTIIFTIRQTSTPNELSILIINDDGRLATWILNGLVLERGLYLQPQKPSDVNWHAVASGDFDGDTKPDIVWQHSDGHLAVWFMSDNILQSSTYLVPDRLSDTDWQVVGAGDFTGEGQTDLLWQHSDGRLAVWEMDGTRMVNSHQLVPDRITDTNWRIASVGDFDADQKLDILWQHEDGSLAVWLMNGTLLRQGLYLQPSQIEDTRWRIVGVGDFNEDQRSDILWSHPEGWMAVWLMDGTRLRSSQYLIPDRLEDLTWHPTLVSNPGGIMP